MYTPAPEDVQFALNVYNTIIFKQILKPTEIKEAYKKLFGEEALNLTQAKIKVSSYFMYQYKKTDIVKDNIPDDNNCMSIDNNISTHEEIKKITKPKSNKNGKYRQK